MAKIQNTITIHHPIKDVFAFVADIRNNIKWWTGVIAAEITSEGSVGVGTTFKYNAEITRRKLETTGELTAYHPPKTHGWKATTGPFPMLSFTIFKSVEGETLVLDMLEPELGGFFKTLSGTLQAVSTLSGLAIDLYRYSVSFFWQAGNERNESI